MAGIGDTDRPRQVAAVQLFTRMTLIVLHADEFGCMLLHRGCGRGGAGGACTRRKPHVGIAAKGDTSVGVKFDSLLRYPGQGGHRISLNNARLQIHGLREDAKTWTTT